VRWGDSETQPSPRRCARPLAQFRQFAVLAVTWTLADADADAGPVVCLRVLPGRAHTVPTICPQLQITSVNNRSVSQQLERFSAPLPGSRREPRLLLRLGVVLRDRQGRHHRGRGLGLLASQVSGLTIGDSRVSTADKRLIGRPRRRPVAAFWPHFHVNVRRVER
jgi:hypothetical protein